MLKINSYSNKGTELSQVTLPKEWEEKENAALLAQAMRVYIDRSHVGLRKAQTRSEVKRTTKKLYSQKGTGGARHGARSAPIFVGGGVAHGPRPESRVLTLPKSMRRKALKVAITLAVDKKKVVAGEINFKKTNEAQKFINKVFVKTQKQVTFVLAKDNLGANRFVRNIGNVRVVNISNLNAFDVFFGGKIVFDNGIFAKEVKEVKKVKKGTKNK